MPPRKPRFTCQPGYPLPGYNGHTFDREHCPNCGNNDVDLIDGFTSGQAIGICELCGANYVVEPAPVVHVGTPHYQTQGLGLLLLARELAPKEEEPWPTLPSAGTPAA
jgi:hypothetical protein